MFNYNHSATGDRHPCNKGKIIGPKAPLQPKHVWAIRTRLHLDHKIRDLALFNLAIDSKLRGCDLLKTSNAGNRYCDGLEAQYAIAREVEHLSRNRSEADQPFS